MGLFVRNGVISCRRALCRSSAATDLAGAAHERRPGARRLGRGVHGGNPAVAPVRASPRHRRGERLAPGTIRTCDLCLRRAALLARGKPCFPRGPPSSAPRHDPRLPASRRAKPGSGELRFLVETTTARRRDRHDGRGTHRLSGVRGEGGSRGESGRSPRASEPAASPRRASCARQDSNLRPLPPQVLRRRDKRSPMMVMPHGYALRLLVTRAP